MTEESKPATESTPPSSEAPPERRDPRTGPTNTSFLLRRPQFLLGAVLMYAGLGIYALSINYPFYLLLERYGMATLAVTVSLYGCYLLFSDYTKSRLLRESRFVDVDERSRARSSSEYENLTRRLNELESSLVASRSPSTPGEEVVERSPDIGGAPPPNFVLYFDSIRRLLEQKAAIADEKASILLDKGTAYSRFGITFFIFCIAAWQVLSYSTGFQHQYIYGIVSTSLLFVFIEKPSHK